MNMLISECLQHIFFSVSAFFQIVPNDTITDCIIPVAPPQEMADILGVERTSVYRKCLNKPCFGCKMVDEKCPKCSSTTFAPSLGVVCRILTQQGDDFDSLTLFREQVDTILSSSSVSLDECVDAEAVENAVISCLPVRVSFVPSPKKDKTVSSLKLVE